MFLESVSKDFTKDEQSEISLNSAAYYFSVNHITVKEAGILNVHQNLIIKMI